MTKQQLDWLIEYINAKCQVVDRRAQRMTVPLHLTDRAADLIGKLEASCEQEGEDG